MDGQTDENTHTWVQTWVMDAETEPPGGGMLHGVRCTDAGMIVHMKKTQEENLITVPPYTAIQSSFWVFPQSYLNKDTN